MPIRIVITFWSRNWTRQPDLSIWCLLINHISTILSKLNCKDSILITSQIMKSQILAHANFKTYLTESETSNSLGNFSSSTCSIVSHKFSIVSSQTFSYSCTGILRKKYLNLNEHFFFFLEILNDTICAVFVGEHQSIIV